MRAVRTQLISLALNIQLNVSLDGYTTVDFRGLNHPGFLPLLNGANIAEVIQLNINKMDIRVLNIVL